VYESTSVTNNIHHPSEVGYNWITGPDPWPQEAWRLEPNPIDEEHWSEERWNKTAQTRPKGTQETLFPATVTHFNTLSTLDKGKKISNFLLCGVGSYFTSFIFQHTVLFVQTSPRKRRMVVQCVEIINWYLSNGLTLKETDGQTAQQKRLCAWSINVIEIWVRVCFMLSLMFGSCSDWWLDAVRKNLESPPPQQRTLPLLESRSTKPTVWTEQDCLIPFNFAQHATRSPAENKRTLAESSISLCVEFLMAVGEQHVGLETALWSTVGYRIQRT